jgi:hypothetical protein
VRQIIVITADLVVEGIERGTGGERFQGRVIALAVDDDGHSGAPDGTSMWLLVADDTRPTPVWVAYTDVSAQRLGRWHARRALSPGAPRAAVGRVSLRTYDAPRYAAALHELAARRPCTRRRKSCRRVSAPRASISTTSACWNS